MGSMNRATRNSAEAEGRVGRMAQPYEEGPTIGELLWPDMAAESKANAGGRVGKMTQEYEQARKRIVTEPLLDEHMLRESGMYDNQLYVNNLYFNRVSAIGRNAQVVSARGDA